MPPLERGEVRPDFLGGSDPNVLLSGDR
jgi:hypothetical protein